MNTTPIPFNKFRTFGRIYSDTTKAALEDHLVKIIGSQAANKRTNNVYNIEVTRLRKAIAAR